jgi:hypothetical protein
VCVERERETDREREIWFESYFERQLLNEVYSDGYLRSMHWKVNFGHQHRISSRIEENHEERWTSWSASVTSGLLTSPALGYEKSKGSLYMRSCLLKNLTNVSSRYSCHLLWLSNEQLYLRKRVEAERLQML